MNNPDTFKICVTVSIWLVSILLILIVKHAVKKRKNILAYQFMYCLLIGLIGCAMLSISLSIPHIAKVLNEQRLSGILFLFFIGLGVFITWRLQKKPQFK
jgi:multisubunit Na+/H+ antiporter MnhB subunit